VPASNNGEPASNNGEPVTVKILENCNKNTRVIINQLKKQIT